MPFFYDAASQIVTQAALVISGFVAEYHAGQFAGECNIIGELEDLLEQYGDFKADGFCDLDACQAWLRKVADFLPMLWD
jgi:hypothetical protein